eukprot:CAMPEP_0172642666 /NCGR_PEP_ID=MMETSP1068-20121228/233240_1 /TAXON_ID=35684 /ORGANISM="Pseudopedinella elastica, Strain CCMP716" /LENGTH=50 /DNA_ID=CAMNT_0013456537 /DNA_START=71 /DNA_END=220 /DNA_ORIENTATION=-
MTSIDQTEEERIILMLQETRASNYCDPKFPADSTALYRDPNFIPAYDSKA